MFNIDKNYMTIICVVFKKQSYDDDTAENGRLPTKSILPYIVSYNVDNTKRRVHAKSSSAGSIV